MVAAPKPTKLKSMQKMNQSAVKQQKLAVLVLVSHQNSDTSTGYIKRSLEIFDQRQWNSQNYFQLSDNIYSLLFNIMFSRANGVVRF